LPFLHVSGVYGVERGCMAIVWPLASHPSNKNEVIVWDLAHDPQELLALDAAQIRERVFVSRADLAPGVTRLPIGTLAINKCPVVVGNLKILTPQIAQRWGVDVDAACRHALTLAAATDRLAGLWPAVFERPARAGTVDVDEDLYGGFVGAEDRRVLDRLRALDGVPLATKRPAFADPRLEELLFRYRARNFPQTLDASERSRWLAHCKHRLYGEDTGTMPLDAYLQHLEALADSADERGQDILGALMDYATQIAPDRD
jgi:exodeoxyribonuclease-1